MDKPLRVLIIEDSHKDVALEVRALETAGYRVIYAVAETAADMKAALAEEPFDIVLSDHDLQQFDAPGAKAVLLESGLDIPFIIVSGAIHEGKVMALVKSGASDYVPKDRLSRLAPTVEYALRDSEKRRKLKQAEEAMRASEEKYRLLADNTVDGVWLLDMNFNLMYCSPASEKQSGFTLQEIMEMSLEQYFTPESLKVVAEAFLEEVPKLEADPDYNPTLNLDLEFNKKDGTAFWAECRFSVIRDKHGKPVSILGHARDITERRLAEKVIRESEDKYRVLFMNSSEGIGVTQDGKFRLANHKLVAMLGYTEQEILSMSVLEFIHPEDREFVMERDMRRLKGEIFENAYQFRAVNKSGETRWVAISTVLIEWGGRPATLDYYSDFTGRKLAEEKLVKSYENLQKTLNDAISTMVKIVEMRDPFTAGHQQKVADLATAIARQMKLEDTLIDQLRMAAVIHDIGKIYVSSDILSKPGGLSDIEFSLIKTHSLGGYDIVKGMDFPCNVAKTVLQHHERLDGSGYPNQLKGDDTLMEAKILAVADVVEAMAAHRPYRPALGIDKALEEIAKNRGRLYDPDVVDACLELFKEKGFKFKE